MAEALGSVVHGNVVMAAGQQGIEKQRIDVALEIPAVHLDTELITQHQRNGEGVMLLIILAVLLSTVDHLLEGHEVLIGDGQRYIGQHLDPLLYPHSTIFVPDHLAVILFVHGHDLVDGGQGLALAEQSHVGHQLAGLALVPAAVLDVCVQIGDAIAKQLHRMEERTADGGTEGQYQSKADKYQKNHQNLRQLTSAAAIAATIRNTEITRTMATNTVSR